MLILLPPSEGKTAARRGKPLDLASLSLPALTPTRERVLDALVALCTDDAEAAASTLGLGRTQIDLVAQNAALREAATARADHVYSGVLFEALDLPSLTGAAKRRATSRLAVTSSLFGLVRPGDRIPAYRLSGDASLPGVGAVASVWREALPQVAHETVGRGLLIDLRSGMYAAFWRPDADLARRTATVRVLHEHQGQRKVVSHFNKATKGRIARALLEDGADPRTPAALGTALSDLGWYVETGEPTPQGTRLDVVVRDL